jgi:hypothetical protein
MVNLSIVIFVLSLGVQIGVGTSGNCEDWAWMGKVSYCCEGSWIGGGGGGSGLASVLTWGLALFGIGHVICGTTRGYAIYGVGEGWG